MRALLKVEEKWMQLSAALKKGTPDALSNAILQITKLESRADFVEVYSLVNSYINKIWNKSKNEEPFLISEKDSLSYLAAHQIFAIINQPQINTKSLLKLYKRIKSFNNKKEPVISEKRIIELLDHIYNLGYMHLINRPKQGRQLTILRIPHRHIKYNSIFGEDANMVMCCPKHPDREGSPEEIFIHELGHSFHSHLTNRKLDIPESFMPIFRHWFYADKIPNGEEGQIIRRDIFADCFSAAVCMKDESLKSLNYFCSTMPPQFLKAMAYYFDEVSKENLSVAASQEFWTEERFDRLNKTLT